MGCGCKKKKIIEPSQEPQQVSLTITESSTLNQSDQEKVKQEEQVNEIINRIKELTKNE